MSYDYEIGQGDLEPPLEIYLAVNGEAFALLPGDTISLEWRLPGGATRSVPMTAELDIDGVPFVRRTWEAGDTDLPGVHVGEVVVERGGRQRTFPSDKSVFKWKINVGIIP